MARPSKFEESTLIQVATTLAADRGPARLTMQALAAALRAPSGSIYHRFQGRPALLAAVWLDALTSFQTAWWAGAEDAPTAEAVALLPLRWARKERARAKVLSAYRSTEFLSEQTPTSQMQAVRSVQRLSIDRLRALSARFLHSTDRREVERIVFALVDIPLAALRRPLIDERPIGRALEECVRTAASAVLEGDR